MNLHITIDYDYGDGQAHAIFWLDTSTYINFQFGAEAKIQDIDSWYEGEGSLSKVKIDYRTFHISKYYIDSEYEEETFEYELENWRNEPEHCTTFDNVQFTPQIIKALVKNRSAIFSSIFLSIA